jgi:signal transduction histidine kinase
VKLRAPHGSDSLLALICALALIGDAVFGNDGRDFAPLAVPLAFIAAAPLAWRRLTPIAVLLASAAGLLLFVAVIGAGDVASLIATIPLYTVALLGDRRRSLIVGIVSGLVLAVAISALAPNESLSSGTIRLLLILSALVVGDTVRSRRALRIANAQRDEQVAREHEIESRRRIADERVRIARELHDSLGHALVAINVRAGVTQHIGDPRESSAALGEIKDVTATALRDLRATLDVLRDRGEAAPTRPSQGLEGLPELAASLRAGGVQTETEVEVNGAPIPSTLGQAAFRIVQESLTNVLRHAGASRARVEVRVIADNLDIEVVDDGSGAVSAPPGHGLRGMAERAGALGGSVEAGPTPGGWRVHAQLPLGGSKAT